MGKDTERQVVEFTTSKRRLKEEQHLYRFNCALMEDYACHDPDERRAAKKARELRSIKKDIQKRLEGSRKWSFEGFMGTISKSRKRQLEIRLVERYIRMWDEMMITGKVRANANPDIFNDATLYED